MKLVILPEIGMGKFISCTYDQKKKKKNAASKICADSKLGKLNKIVNHPWLEISFFFWTGRWGGGGEVFKVDT